MTENKMGTMPVNRLLVSMSVPMMISMLVQALYNIVDSMFVAKLSENALTAVSFAFPVQSLMIAVATGTGVGVNALLSKSLGEKNFAQANKAATVMAGRAMESLKIAFDGFVTEDESAKEKVDELNGRVSEMERAIVAYLIKISSQDVSLTDEKLISAIHHSTGDILRISELADNITKYTRNCRRDGIEFSAGVKKSLQDMYAKIDELYQKTLDVFDKKDITAIKAVDRVEDDVDAARKEMIADHIRRLNEGKCKPQSSGIFINLVGNLERAADHLTYIAHAFD